MKLGQRNKRSKTWPEAGLLGKPQHVSAASTVGLVTSDLIGSVYLPLILDTAEHILETYVGEVADYEEALAELTSTNGEAEIEADGSLLDDMLETPMPRQPPFHSQFAIRELTETLQDTSDFFFPSKAHTGSSYSWKVVAKAARFERLMDAKYGVLRPFLKDHPQLEVAIRSLQRKYHQGFFSPLRQGDPPIPRTTAVIILFMMQRGNVPWPAMVLATLFFLVGLQPWALVMLLVVGQALWRQRRGKAVGGMKKKIPRVVPYYQDMNDGQRLKALGEPVGTPLESATTLATDDFDVILLGSNVPTLYTAALLSRAGRRVLVLSSRKDASGCLTLENLPPKLRATYATIPFDVDASNVAKISKQQAVLAPALCTDVDAQGGVRFAQVGSAADGHAFEILSMPGVGTEGVSDEIPIVLTAAAKEQIMEDAASYLGDGWPGSDGSVGNSTAGVYLGVCENINQSASLYYLSKILPDTVNSFRSKSTYGECAVRYVQSLLNKSFPLNAHPRSLMAGIGMKMECLRPNATSLAAHVTHLSAAVSGEGMHYPIGGPRALARALAHVVESAGGQICTNAEVDEFLFDENHLAKTTSSSHADGKEDNPPCPRCVGVKLKDGKKIKFSSERYKSGLSPVVVDTDGFIHSYIHLLPPDIRTKYKVPRGLPALAESRPVFKILLGLKGTATDLNVTGADYYRLPNAARAQDEATPVGTIRHGDIGWPMEAEESPAITSDETEEDAEKPLVETVNEDTEATETKKFLERQKKGKGVQYRPGESWLHISFPSAKDPSFTERHGDVTTCVVTIEADDDFVQAYDTKPALYVARTTVRDATKIDRLLQSVKKDLFSIYPQLEDKVQHAEVRGVIHRGLSHTPERYAARGLRPESPYPGLFVSGPDLTVGGSFAASIVAGWLTVNAVIGYSYLDLLFLRKNVTSDIERFLAPPDLYEEEDVAVPYTPPTPPLEPMAVETVEEEYDE
jgi:phytoene dehydrogenase-like protein